MSSKDDKNKLAYNDETANLETKIGDAEMASSEHSFKMSIRSTSSRLKVGSHERQQKLERARKCLENAALVSKQIQEHRKATAQLLEGSVDDVEKVEHSHQSAVEMSVPDALSMPGISESLSDTLKQKEILMEKIKQSKARQLERSKKERTITKEYSESVDTSKNTDFKDILQLQTTIREKDEVISALDEKIKQLETTVVDLKDKCSEKDSLIKAKTKASSLISDSMTKKEKEALNLLEDTKLHLREMQEKFSAVEFEMNEERKRLLSEIEQKNNKIAHLEEANSILENARFEISIAHSKLVEELELRDTEIQSLQEQLKAMENTISSKPIKNVDTELEKGSLEISTMDELTRKIEFLEQLNSSLRQTNLELEINLSSIYTETDSAKTPPKKIVPQKTQKRSKSSPRNTSIKQKSPWSDFGDTSMSKEESKREVRIVDTVVQKLNKELVDKEFAITQNNLLIQKQRQEIEQKDEEIKLYQQLKLMSEDAETIDTQNEEVLECELKSSSQGIGTQSKIDEAMQETDLAEPTDILRMDEVTAESTGIQRSDEVTALQVKLDAANEQILALTEEIDAANKNMLKVKSAHKNKVKQLQKCLDGYSQVSDAHAALVQARAEVATLSQRVAELEEDKGNLQLHLVDYDSGRLTEPQLHQKLSDIEKIAETRLKAISDLETQKFDLVQDLHMAKQKIKAMEDQLVDLSQLQSEQVTSEMTSLQLEEQLDKLSAHNRQLEAEKLKLEEAAQNILQEKAELTNKLDHYIQENMELTDRIEKSSTEKVSSAESIEIVDSLTTQEKMEIEEYNKNIQASNTGLESSEPTTVEVGNVNLNESLIKLSQESAELNQKIELFTRERCEVMEKMDKLKNENERLQVDIREMQQQNDALEEKVKILSDEKKTQEVTNQEISYQIEILKSENVETQEESGQKVAPSQTEGLVETEPQEDKTSKAKNVKQLTKDILKLKNTIKEREAEIGDCQVKILALEELNNKQLETLDNIKRNEQKLIEDNNRLQTDLDNMFEIESKKIDVGTEDNLLLNDEIQNLKDSVKLLQKERHEHIALITTKESKIQEMEEMIQDYQIQIQMYNETLLTRDQAISDSLNQISQLNSVSQKLKSTIDLLEEEKTKDQNGEVIKGLNKQISSFQSAISDKEQKIQQLESDQLKISNLSSELERRVEFLEKETQDSQFSLQEKTQLIKDLRDETTRQKKDIEEYQTQCKEKDEEIHEIKLQLRRESIEHETLRKTISEAEGYKKQQNEEIIDISGQHKDITARYNKLHEDYTALETKNKEMLDKLKKFALNLKKKSNNCAELEQKINQANSELEQTRQQLNNASEIIAATKNTESETENLKAELTQIYSQYQQMENMKASEIANLSGKMIQLQSELQGFRSENESLRTHLTSQIDSLASSNKILSEQLENQCIENENLKKDIKECEGDLEKSSNLMRKISDLEGDVNNKQQEISALLTELDNLQKGFNQVKFGHEAKLQEKDAYIESLELDLGRHKQRISRLEESISTMEDRRHSLEREADQLGSQLMEKQTAYRDYHQHEDELVKRLAALMDHDDVVQKQLKAVEQENMNHLNKIQSLADHNQRLSSDLAEYQEKVSSLTYTQDECRKLEEELSNANTKAEQFELQVKKILQESEKVLQKKQEEYVFLEAESHMHIETAIKEKKALGGQCERLVENVQDLQQQLDNAISNYNSLRAENVYLLESHQKIQNKPDTLEDNKKVDYTDGLITEINNLQAVISQNAVDLQNYQQHILQLQMSQQSPAHVDLDDLKGSLVKKEQEVNNLMVKLEEALTKEMTLSTRIQELNELLAESIEQIENLKNGEAVKTATTVFEEMVKTTQNLESKINPLENIDLTDLQDQIITESTPELSCEGGQGMIRSFEHNTTDHAGEKSKPEYCAQLRSSDALEVKEEVILPKTTYDCFIPTQEVVEETSSKTAAPLSALAFDDEDGWGLGDAEQQYLETSYLQATASESRQKLDEEIKHLRENNDRLIQENSQFSIKLAKAFKKLKEFKLKNDSMINELKLSQKKGDGDDSLNKAIQDELAGQIKLLEGKIKELEIENARDKQEKQSLLKRIDVLGAANEKVIEMKEKLDSEVGLWKFKFKEANEKLTSFDWEEDKNERVEPPESRISDNCNKEVDKLMDTIDKLEKENAELHILLDEVRISQKEYQDTKKVESNVRNEIDSLTKENGSLQNKVDALEKELKVLTTDKSSVTENNNNLLGKINDLEKKNENLTKENKELFNELKKAESELEKVSIDLQRKQQELKNLEIICTAHQLKIQELKATVVKLNEENNSYLSTMTELQSNLTAAVDQRGFEVAEMWKQHLAQRENDFAQLEQQIRAEVIVVEDKYRQLTENVKSCTQQETNQLLFAEQIASLQQKLQQREETSIEVQTKYNESVTQIELLRSEVDDEKNIFENKLLMQRKEYEKMLSDAEIKYKDLLTEKEQRVTTLNNQLLENHQTLENLSKDLQEKDNFVRTLTNKLSEKDQTGQNVELLEKDNHIQALTYELSEKDNHVQTLSNQLSEKDQTILGFSSKLSQVDQFIQTLSTELSEKNQHIQTVSNELSARDKHIQALSNELLEKKKEIDSLNSQLFEKEQYIQALTNEITVFQTASNETRSTLLELTEFQQNGMHLESKLKSSEELIAKLQQNVDELLTQLKRKEAELFQKTQEYTLILQQTNEEFESVRQQLLQREKQFEDLQFEKESELANLRLKSIDETKYFENVIADLEDTRGKLENALTEKVEELRNIQKQKEEINILLGEENKQMSDMRDALEKQEEEIVYWKDILAQTLESAQKSERHVTFAADTKLPAEIDSTSSSHTAKNLDPIPNAELDLALYMLHQRDVRCEELTVELTHLLEERDTLQLRLSDALRACEDMRVKSGASEVESSTTEFPREGASREVLEDPAGTHGPKASTSRSSASPGEEIGDKAALQTKLSELKSVRHQRDVLFRDESEQRYRDMALLQRDVAHLPHDAEQRLRHAQYTLTRDSQSTPTVLLNWLLGKSTPKVVDM